ncbi:alpha-tectorin-like [Elgaria multicarinata webbii]|uniref:alpha-tectorin-like n=1 Tax=Elgaria multicarinata webbii TaxID=159646 RepID=UPI002FCCFE87
MKTSLAFLFLLLEHILYPYGEAVGDMKNPKDDDGTSPPVPISQPFIFYGKTYHSVYVNNNGVVSFSVPVPEYTPKPIPLVDGKAFVAPYWGDVNNILGGEVYYRDVHDPELLKRITSDINKYFPNIPFKVTWAFVATWDRVAYFGSMSNRVNTFQAVLCTDGHTAFVIFNYGRIQWTTGAASNGDPRTGLDGIPAQAGFNSGDDKNYYSIPDSRTPRIVNITKTSNVQDQGRWVFQVDNFKVTGVPEELMPKKEPEPVPPVVQEPVPPVVQEPVPPVVQEPVPPAVQEPVPPVVQEPVPPVVQEPVPPVVQEPVPPVVQEPVPPVVQEPVPPVVQEPVPPVVQEPVPPAVQEPVPTEVQELVPHLAIDPVHPDFQEPGVPEVEEPVGTEVEEPEVPNEQKPVLPIEEIESLEDSDDCEW